MDHWPKQDQIRAGVTDLRILLNRGMSVEQAAERLGIDHATAYRWLNRTAS